MTTNLHPSMVPDTAIRHKEAGGGFFAAKNYQSALGSYRNSRDCLDHTIVWPKQERFALTLHSNMAACHLKLQQPREAVEECQKAARLPVFQIQIPERLREKILFRQAEALLDWNDQSTGDVSNENVWSVLDLARRFGYLSHKASSWETRQKFLQLGARTIALKQEQDDAVQGGLQAWTDHLARTQVITVEKAVEARRQYQEQAMIIEQNNKENEQAKQRCGLERLALELALNILESLLPKPKLSVGEVCHALIDFMRQGTSPSKAVAFLRQILGQGGLHACQVDEDDTGYFLWAICFGLTQSPPGDGPVNVFIALLSLLVDEFGVCIDQRAKSGESQSRNPLHYVVKSGQPRAVQAMLDRGAQVNLRDDDGWTALAAVCRNDVKTPNEGGSSVAERVETASLLLDAGADVEAETVTGFTPILALCTKSCAPLFRLLLSHGADPNRVSFCGLSSYGLLLKMGKHSEDAAECLNLLSSHETDSFAGEEAKAAKFEELVDDLVAANNQIGKSSVPASGKTEGLRQRAKQELHVLNVLFDYLGLDSSVLRKRLSASDGNWLEELHTRVNALVPDCYLQVYCGQLPTDRELALMVSHSGEATKAGMAETEEGVSFFDEQAAHAALFAKWRDRGLTYRANMVNFQKCVVDPIQHCIGFAIPSDAVLERIERFGPVVEAGAGTGYLTALLQARGVDAVAYDLSPPTEDHEASNFFNHTYTDVQEGDAKYVFSKDPALATRTLLMVWPNNPDRLDSHLYEGEHLPPVWDADCLEQYMQAGGSTVIYIGEREDSIKVDRGHPPDCGTSSSRRFQTMLKERFRLIEQHKIPQWFKCADDVTIWKRK